MTIPIFKREIKSFVRRQRRLSVREEKAMQMAWPQCGVLVADTDAQLDLNAIFNRQASRVCEIGFGHGDTLIPMAIAHPDCDYLGIEVHEPGIASVMLGIIEHRLKNVRVIQNDAVKILEHHIPDASFSRIHIYFPDPWQKKRHYKRRLIQPDFVNLLIQKLTKDGVLHFATDWENYAQQMMQVLSASEKLVNCAGENQFADNDVLQLRANTKFEKRGVLKGHGVWDLLFRVR